MDLVMVVDTSCGAHVSNEQCNYLKQHLKKLASHFEVGTDIRTNTRISVIGYNSAAQVSLPLTAGTSIEAVYSAIDKLACNGEPFDHNSLVAGIDAGLLEFEMGKRSDVEVDRAMFFYPICPSDNKQGLCDSSREAFGQLRDIRVSVLVSGEWTTPENYTCLIDASKNY
jgi:hypothetical protein